MGVGRTLHQAVTLVFPGEGAAGDREGLRTNDPPVSVRKETDPFFRTEGCPGFDGVRRGSVTVAARRPGLFARSGFAVKFG